MRFLYHVMIALFLAGTMFTGCGNRQRAGILSFKPDSIPSFTIDIDKNRDTVIHTPGGAILRILANTLDGAGSSHVKLLIKEAYRVSDIVRAGLFTNSNGQALSSGGMINIEPEAGQRVTIKGSIDIRIPTHYLEKNMQLYKGVPDEKGNLNWTDPQPLQTAPGIAALDQGAQTFQSGCQSCHRIGSVITGPDLSYIRKRRTRKWLYEFVRNNSKVLLSGDRYANCLFQHYNNTAMPIYPALTDLELDALFTFIDNESYRLGLPFPDDHLKKCADSCELYNKRKDNLLDRRNKMIADNGTSVTVDKEYPSGNAGPVIASLPVQSAIPPITVTVPDFQSEYYQINIKTFGWYNIDILLKGMNGVKESELMVRLIGEYKSEVNLYLIIPSARVFLPGGKLESGKDEWGFYTLDGKISLPQGGKAIIMAMGEKNGKLAFGMQSFQITEKQSFTLESVAISKELMNARIKELDLQDFQVQAKDSKNADSIRKTDRQLQDLERLRPKSCNCNCGIVSDSTGYIE